LALHLKVSIVIPAYNEEKLLPEALQSIQAACAAFDARGWEREIIVCDNNSTDGTAAVAHAAGVTVVFEPINQISRARNTGAAAATGDWLVFVDADSFPSVELFNDVADEIAGGRTLAGGCLLKFNASRSLAAQFVPLWNWFSRCIRWMAGSFIFCETTVFRQIGGFSLELFVSEELDLSRRLKAAARRMKRKIVILHKHPLVTSSRKLHLYTLGDYFSLFWKIISRRGRSLKDREDCYIWYDGRR
jgi:glycosyltransferase involved in cell wall biosynthesis